MLPSLTLLGAAVVSLIAQTPGEVVNPAAWTETLTQVGPLGVVCLALIWVMRERAKAADDHNAEHAKRIDEYHEQEKKRADSVLAALTANTKAMTELTGVIDEMRCDIDSRNGGPKSS